MLDTTPSHPRDASLKAHEQRLLTRLCACARRAAETGQPALVRLHVPLPGLSDPWRLWRSEPTAKAPFFVINDGRMGLCAAAWGHLEQHFLPRNDRFGAARACCSKLLEQVVDICWDGADALDVDAPLAFAGFAFADAGADAVWESWQGGSIYVPQTLVYRRDHAKQGHGVLCATVTAHSDLSLILREFSAQLGRLTERDAGLAESATPSDVAMALPEDESTWMRRVEAARGAARAGTLDKVVLARAADFTAPEGKLFDARATLWALRRAHAHSICFAMGHGDGSVFLGATPEILVQVSGREMSTQAVAGTAPRGVTPQEDTTLGEGLVHSAKDRGEHAVVADVLTDVLEPLCVELHRPNAPRLIRLPRLQHLETPFIGTLRQAGGVLELVERLHPTPSVGGWPAQKALAWLREHERMDRGWYAGPVGWLTAAGDGTFAVAIRSVLMQGKVARAYVGAGIVAASDPHAEWQETELKLRTVREALRLRHGAETAETEA